MARPVSWGELVEFPVEYLPRPFRWGIPWARVKGLFVKGLFRKGPLIPIAPFRRGPFFLDSDTGPGHHLRTLTRVPQKNKVELGFRKWRRIGGFSEKPFWALIEQFRKS